MKNMTIPLSESREWFSRWFDSPFYHRLYRHRSEQEAMNFVENLLNEIQPAPLSKMLDLGCGNGRHSKVLASKGFDVTGIDLASSSIFEAKRLESDQLRFYRRDMREPFGHSYFDYVFNFFTSFGYFKTNEEDERVMGNIAASLKHGGSLVMDYINGVHAIKNLIREEKKEIDGIVYHITRYADESHIFKKIRVEENRRTNIAEFTEQIRILSVTDFESICNKNGLRILSVFGDYTLNDYEIENSPRIILVAKKGA